MEEYPVVNLSGNVVIEVTRMCNLSCVHCLRGEAKAATMNTKYLEELLSKFDTVSNVTFSGGEPSLFPEAIDEFFKIAKRFKVDVQNFYIATNATDHSKVDAFIISCINAYLSCSENEISMLEVSNDSYHNIDSFVVEKLKTLKFARYRYDVHFGGAVISEGNAEDWGGRKPFERLDRIDEDGWFDELIYLNCNGNIIDGCDFSYDNQSKHKICGVAELSYDVLTEYLERKNE